MRFQQFNKENTVMWFTNWTMGMTRPVTLYYSVTYKPQNKTARPATDR